MTYPDRSHQWPLQSQMLSLGTLKRSYTLSYAGRGHPDTHGQHPIVSRGLHWSCHNCTFGVAAVQHKGAATRLGTWLCSQRYGNLGP